MNNLIHSPYLLIIARCLAVYLFVIFAIRIFGKKELAQLSVIDLVFILLISNSVQNAMVGPDTSLEGGIIAALSLFIVNFILKKILYRSKSISTLVQGKAILLIYKGVVQEHQLVSAELTIEELEAAVREHGIQDIQHVDLAMLEVDGNISVISDDFQNKSNKIVSAMGHRKKHKFRGRLNQG